MGFVSFELLVFFDNLYHIVNSSIEHHFMTYCLASSVSGHSILFKVSLVTRHEQNIKLLTPDYHPHWLIHL